MQQASAELTPEWRRISKTLCGLHPIITLIEKPSALKWEMRKIREFATIPGLLGWGRYRRRRGGAWRRQWNAQPQPGRVAVLLTGPATITGPVTFQGTTAYVMLDGSVIQRTLTSGTYNRSRQRQ